MYEMIERLGEDINFIVRTFDVPFDLSDGDKADAAQEALFELLKGIAEGKQYDLSDYASSVRLVHTIMRNHLVDQYRHKAGRGKVTRTFEPLEEDTVSVDWQEELEARIGASQQLEALIDEHLTAKEAKAFRTVYIDKLSTHPSVMRCAQRAKEKLETLRGDKKVA